MKRKHKYVVFGINPQLTDIVVLKTSEDPDYEAFRKEFPNDQCRWAVYDLEYNAEDGGKRNKVVFVYWCVPFILRHAESHLTRRAARRRSPGNSTIKHRMVYSASNNILKGRLGIAVEIQGNDEDDLEYVSGKSLTSAYFLS